MRKVQFISLGKLKISNLPQIYSILREEIIHDLSIIEICESNNPKQKSPVNRAFQLIDQRLSFQKSRIHPYKLFLGSNIITH